MLQKGNAGLHFTSLSSSKSPAGERGRHKPIKETHSLSLSLLIFYILVRVGTKIIEHLGSSLVNVIDISVCNGNSGSIKNESCDVEIVF